MKETIEITKERFNELVEVEKKIESDFPTLIVVEDLDGKKVYNLRNMPEELFPVTKRLIKENKKLKEELELTANVLKNTAKINLDRMNDDSKESEPVKKKKKKFKLFG